MALSQIQHLKNHRSLINTIRFPVHSSFTCQCDRKRVSEFIPSKLLISNQSVELNKCWEEFSLKRLMPFHHTESDLYNKRFSSRLEVGY